MFAPTPEVPSSSSPDVSNVGVAGPGSRDGRAAFSSRRRGPASAPVMPGNVLGSRSMGTLDDVAHIALELPEVVEGEGRSGRMWSVRGKTFAWERPFSKADLRRFGDAPVP